MSDPLDTQHDLADVNYRGAAFLLAYGVTWLVCAALWRAASSRATAYATLFQGMVAFPVALGASFALGMFENRPGEGILTQLGVLVAMSQLLVLPLLIALVITGRNTLRPPDVLRHGCRPLRALRLAVPQRAR